MDTAETKDTSGASGPLCGDTTLPVSEFTTSNCGSPVGTATGNMSVGSVVSINGSTTLNGCISYNGGHVDSIIYQSHTGAAREMELKVYGAGPTSGSLHLTFYAKDTGGEHTLTLTSSTAQCHTDVFEEHGNITAIGWVCDT